MDIDLAWSDYKLTNILLFTDAKEPSNEYKKKRIHYFIAMGYVNNDIVTWNHLQEYFQLEPDSLYAKCTEYGLKLSKNPYTTWEHVLQYPHFRWNYEILSSHPNISWKIIYNHPLLLWCPRASMNPHVTKEIVDMYPDFPWSEKYLCQNKNFTVEMIREYFPRIALCDLILNPNATWDLIEEYPEYPWQYNSYAHHVMVTWDVLRNNRYKNWSLGLIAMQNPHITWKNHILKYPFLFGDHHDAFLLSNPNTTFDLIHNYLYPVGTRGCLFEILMRGNFSLEKKIFYQTRQQFQCVLQELLTYYFHPARAFEFLSVHGHIY